MNETFGLILWAIGIYAALFVILMVSWGILYLYNLVIVMIEAWATKGIVTPADLSVQNTSGIPLLVMPIMYPLFLLIFLIIMLVQAIGVTHTVWVHKIMPSIRVRKIGKIRFVPKWIEHDNMSRMINRRVHKERR